MIKKCVVDVLDVDVLSKLSAIITVLSKAERPAIPWFSNPMGRSCRWHVHKCQLIKP